MVTHQRAVFKPLTHDMERKYMNESSVSKSKVFTKRANSKYLVMKEFKARASLNEPMATRLGRRYLRQLQAARHNIFF